MQFNTADYAARHAFLKADLEKGRKEWAESLPTRWAAFKKILMDRQAESLETFLTMFQPLDGVQKKHVVDTREHLAKLQAEIDGILSGDIAITDPAGAEATLRLYEEAANPPPAD